MKLSRKQWALIGIGLLLSFALFSKAAKQGTFTKLDFDTTVKLQDRMPERLDGLWEDAAYFVSPGVSVFLVGLLTITAFVSAKTLKKKFASLAIPLAFILLVGGELYGKTVVNHPAPPFFMIKHPTTLFPQYYINEQFSYPSGHTARAVFLSLLVSGISYKVLGKKKGNVIFFALVVYCVIVATGRMYLGHHWSSDIIGGVLLGGGMGVLTRVSLTCDIDRRHGIL